MNSILIYHLRVIILKYSIAIAPVGPVLPHLNECRESGVRQNHDSSLGGGEGNMKTSNRLWVPPPLTRILTLTL